MDWSWLPTNGSDGPNDIVFRVHYNGMFFFDPLGYNQGRVVEMDGCSKHRVMYTHLLNMLAAKVKDVHAMYDLVEIHKKINVYITHVPQKLAEFYHNNLTLDGSDEEVTFRKKLHLEHGPLLIEDKVYKEPLQPNNTEIGNGGKIIDAEVLAKQQKLDKGKAKLSEADIFTSKKWQPLQRGNGITIRDNENHLPTDTDSSDSEDNSQSKSESDCSEKSFDYLSNCDDEFDKSTSKKVIAKCGKRKEVIKDADIGKQKAFKKFPCNDEKPLCKWRCYGKIMKDEASFQYLQSLKQEARLKRANTSNTGRKNEKKQEFHTALIFAYLSLFVYDCFIPTIVPKKYLRKNDWLDNGEPMRKKWFLILETAEVRILEGRKRVSEGTKA
uniref:Pentatricopeptide repeat-containing protein n=1 Tax=Tanacetum cinerariifolium TaxID=118510 RepID=A0A6L2KIN4_TANCI|nr:pentatricopeptide repeat-containing protein [Tanacetum cinerariifolium]